MMAKFLAPKDVWRKYWTLLLPYPSDEDDDRFVQAIAAAFGLDDEPLLLRQLSNRDLLWLPDAEECDGKLNALQYAAFEECSQRNPLLSTFSYLFEEKEPYYDEPYFDNDNDNEGLREREDRLAFRCRVREHFPTAKSYVQRVMTVLFRDSDYRMAEFEPMVHAACFTHIHFH